MAVGALLGALFDTEAYAGSEFAWPRCVARAVKFVDPITIAVGHSAEEMLVGVLFILLFDGEGVSLYQPAANASRVRFSDNGEEPPRRGLYAAQELVRTVRAAATLPAACEVRCVAVAFSHRCLDQASTNERRIEVAHFWSVVVYYSSGYVV